MVIGMLKEEKELDEIWFETDTTMYFQQKDGLHRAYYDQEDGDLKYEPIGRLYIYQITIIRDVYDRYEPLYNLEYEDMIYNERKIVKNRTFNDLINFIDKQKLILCGKECIEFILSVSIIFENDRKVNGIPFVIKEKVNFGRENLPMHGF